MRKKAQLPDRFQPLLVTLVEATSQMPNRSGTAGVVEFSRVAFGNPGNEALVYVAHTVGDLNARGYVLWLTQVAHESWRIRGRANLWVA
jgi:hypothetical protein